MTLTVYTMVLWRKIPFFEPFPGATSTRGLGSHIDLPAKMAFDVFAKTHKFTNGMKNGVGESVPKTIPSYTYADPTLGILLAVTVR